MLGAPYGFSVLAALPPDLPLGRAKLALAFNGSEKGEADVEVVASNFALFSIVQGIGPAAARNVNVNAGIQPNALVTPARPGDYVTLWGSGLGATPQKGATVLLGEQPVPVQYAGPAPSLKGLDQINILVPDDVRIADGCYVPVVVQIGEQRSVPSLISKATGPGACLHPLGLSTEQMARLNAGGSVPFGEIGVYSMIGPARTDSVPSPQGLVRSESANASFLDVGAAIIALSSLTRTAPEPGCHQLRGIGGVFSSLLAELVNMGDKLTLSGPDGKSVDVTAEGGLYHWLAQSGPVQDPAQLPPPVLVAGKWQITAPGSEQAKGFQVPLRLPPPIQVTNFEQLRTIDRTQDVTVTWNPQGYAVSDTMELQLSGPRTVETTTGVMTAACTAPATAGSITIPSALASIRRGRTQATPLPTPQSHDRRPSN